MLADISYSLLLAWSTDLKGGLSPYNSLELQRIKAVTRRGIWAWKLKNFHAFEISLRLLLSPEKCILYEEYMGIFCKLSKNWQGIWWVQCCLGASDCCCRQDVPQWRFRVAVVNRAAPSLQEKYTVGRDWRKPWVQWSMCYSVSWHIVFEITVCETAFHAVAHTYTQIHGLTCMRTFLLFILFHSLSESTHTGSLQDSFSSTPLC